MKTIIYLQTSILFLFIQISSSTQENVIPLYPGKLPHSKIPPGGYQELNDTANGYFTNISFPSLTVSPPAFLIHAGDDARVHLRI